MSRNIRILSLDGGGIRGVIPGVILSYLELELRKRNPDSRLSDYFDLLAGTSTGGILVCGYLAPDSRGRPRYSAQEVVDIYLDRGGEIFHVSFGHVLASLRTIYSEKFDADALERALGEYFGDTMLSQLLKPCLITAYDIRNRRARFFNQADGSSETRDFRVRDVARATSAAPTFFEASLIQSKLGTSYPLIDGGLVANNPGMCAYAEARTMDFRTALDDVSAPVKPTAQEMTILSIGTGKVTTPYRFEDAKDWGTVSWIIPIIDIMMTANSESVDYQLKQIFRTTDQPDNYIRLEPDLHDASPDMDDTSSANLHNLREAALQFISKNEDQLQKVVGQLVASE